MRTVRQSTFRQPLDDVLGTVSTVRVLRELALHGEALSPTDLAARVSLSKTSVGAALSTLVGMALVEPVGSGRYTSYRFSDSHFLGEPLRTVFQQEAARTDRVFGVLRAIADQADPVPEAVWVYGSVARGEDRPGSDLDVVVVVSSPDHRQALDDIFREGVLALVEDWDVTPSIVVLTEDEISEGIRSGREFFTTLEEAVPVYGRLPHQLATHG